jgi:transcriptional regulator with XRE-family HTH domain
MNFTRSNVAHLMAERGLQEEHLAKAAGLTQPTVNRFLTSATGDIKLKTALAWAKLFETTVDALATHDFRAGRPVSSSASPEWDKEALRSALVSLDKGMQALNVSYRNVQDMEAVLVFAYNYLARHPEMSNQARGLFDELLISKLKEAGYGTSSGSDRRLGTRARGRKAAAAE